MKTVDITFHLPENSLEAEAALKSMEMVKVLNELYLRVYESEYDYDFWNKLHIELDTILNEKGLNDLISRV